MTAFLPAVPSSRRIAAALTLGLSSAAFAQQGPLRGFDAYTAAAIKAVGMKPASNDSFMDPDSDQTIKAEKEPAGAQ